MADLSLSTRSAISAANLPTGILPVQIGGGGPWLYTTGQSIADLPPQLEPVTVSASRNLTNADNGKTLTVTGANVILTIPSGLAVGFGCLIEQQGTTQVTIAWSSPVTTRNVDNHTKTAARYAMCSLVYVGANTYNFCGRTGA